MGFAVVSCCCRWVRSPNDVIQCKKDRKDTEQYPHHKTIQNNYYKGNFRHCQKGNILLELIKRKTFRCQQMSIIICEAVENKPLNIFHHVEVLKVFL